MAEPVASMISTVEAISALEYAYWDRPRENEQSNEGKSGRDYCRNAAQSFLLFEKTPQLCRAARFHSLCDGSTQTGV